MSFTHPGQLNPDIVEPAGRSIRRWACWPPGIAEGKCVGCIVNYACHGTCNPGGISANWIYYMEQTIQGAMGKDCVVVFLQGACGDITQVNNLDPYVFPGPEDWCRLVGGRVGAEAVKVLLTMARGPMGPVDVRRRGASDQTPRAEPRAREEGSRTRRSSRPRRSTLPSGRSPRRPCCWMRSWPRNRWPRSRSQAIQVGPVVFVSNPAEYFVQLGLEIKAKSPFPFTFPVELANDCVGYVPTEEAFGPHGGGYETRLTSYSNLEITAGTKIAEAGLELARQMKPGVVPAPAKAPAFRGQPWAYGDVPPQKD